MQEERRDVATSNRAGKEGGSRKMKKKERKKIHPRSVLRTYARMYSVGTVYAHPAHPQ